MPPPSIDPVVRGGTPVLGTCAGLIMLDRELLGLLDETRKVDRNAFGRQLRSFETELQIDGGPLRPSSYERRGSRARAPTWGSSPRSTATPFAVREGRILAMGFHPELTDDPRVHRCGSLTGGEG